MTPRTSATDPLLIATLPAGRGALGITLCPGKKQVGARSGTWQRDLDADLAQGRDWGARLVVSAIESSELRELDVEALPEAVEERGLEWHQVPIRDRDIPGIAGEARWFWASTRIHRALANGERVLLHCKGGLGRSGLLAARVLVERGMDARDAIAAVRAVRQGAIETSEQEAYVERVQRVATLPTATDPPTFAERVLGCLLGGAVGDGFGYEVEFATLASIRSRFGADGLQAPVLHHGKLMVSDDTQMTLFTAEGMIRQSQGGAKSGSPTPWIWRAYQRWLETQGQRPPVAFGSRGWLMDEPSLRHARAPGNTCLGALSSGVMGTRDRPTNDSKGCGTVMRTAPTGLLSGSSVRLAYENGVAFAALTHGHETGQAAAGVLSCLLHHLCHGQDIAAAARQASADADALGKLERVTSTAVAAALAAAAKAERDLPAGGLGQGWVAEEALAIGLWAALVGRDFKDSVALASNHDGDSDSTASVAGHIRGAHEGVQSIPSAWARRLDVLEPLLVLAHDLVEVNAVQASPRFLRPYPSD